MPKTSPKKTTEATAATPVGSEASTPALENAVPAARKRAASVRKPAAKKKLAAATSKKRAAKSPAKARKPAAPSDAEIRLRAYFIAERRLQLALHGDPAKDWLEAKQQLEEEARAER